MINKVFKSPFLHFKTINKNLFFFNLYPSKKYGKKAIVLRIDKTLEKQFQ